MTFTTGKLRGLQQLSNPSGLLLVVALDHRDSLKKMLGEGMGDQVSYQDIVDFKVDLCRVVAPHAGAVLLDPVFGASQVIAAGALPGSRGLLVSMEESGYKGTKRARVSELLSGWSVEKARRVGASAAKLLVYYRPDLKETASRQRELVQRVAQECIQADMPLLVEAVSYSVSDREDDAQEFARIKPRLVIETARELTALPVDVLKAEFPGDLSYEKDEARLLDSCQQLDSASARPWVILSGGHSFELFRKEVEIACKGGASGFLAGRALWQEATRIKSRSERVHFFETTVVARLREVSEIANAHGRPWYAKLGVDNGQFPPPEEGWYRVY